MEYGGLGGLAERRELDADDKFEMAVEKALGDAIRADREVGVEMWSALANVDWYHPESGDTAGYSFRAAGDMIAAIRGEGDYMDWYCSGDHAVVSERVGDAMKKEGWIYDTDPPICDEPGCPRVAGCGSPTKSGYRWTCSEHMPVTVEVKP